MDKPPRQAHGRLNRRMFAAGCAAWLGSGAMAQAPSGSGRTLRLVAPSPPGSLADLAGRLYAAEMGEALHAPVIVDNRPGAGGSLAADAVVRAPADGLTVLLATDSLLAINPFMYSKLPYDPVKDLRPVSLLGRATVVLVASPALQAATLADFIRTAKARPGALSYGSGGVGHTTHLAVELFLRRAGLQAVHVAYRGTTPAMQGLLGGETAFVITGLAEALPHIKAGKAVALATSGPVGKSTFPQLPELKEIHPDLDFAFWFAAMVPAATGTEQVQRLRAAVEKAALAPELARKLGEFGFTPASSPPEAVSQLIAADQAKYGAVIQALGIKAD